MAGFIDSKIGLYPQALQVYEKRAEMIAGNLAHENTPGYKAKDLDFKAALKDVTDNIVLQNKGETQLVTKQFNVNENMLNHMKYRSVTQPSVDGNTVDGRVEHAAFAENSVRYLAALNILNDRVKNLMLAIKGS